MNLADVTFDAQPPVVCASNVIAGIGVDLVEIAALERRLKRQPKLLSRLFTPAEQNLKIASLAARAAAKEAVGKALGNPQELSWQDVSVEKDDRGRPRLKLSGAAQARAAELAIMHWHLSLSHDGEYAIAYVVAERIAD